MALDKKSVVMSVLLVQLLVVASKCINPVEGSCDFGASCLTEELSGTTLSASCSTISGNPNPTSLDLNANIANNNGTLFCNQNGGNYNASCYDIVLMDGQTLSGNCKNIAGTPVEASVDLNSCIANIDGKLSWC